MATILQANNLSLGEVHRLYNFHREYNNSFSSLLSLDNITDFESQELSQIRHDFDNYLSEGSISEGQVKMLTIAPLLRLAGFYHSPIKITLEENIADIEIEDEDTLIKGRLDILAVNKIQKTNINTSLWILVIETKNSQVDPSVGLPQLLTYAYKSLQYQESVWGLTTNGMRYQFVYLQSGNPLNYQLMPFLNLMEVDESIEILQVLKAIVK